MGIRNHIESYITKEETNESAGKKIEAKMKNFPNLSWMINVYPPHDKHKTNVNVFYKREFNRNIAIHIEDNNQEFKGFCYRGLCSDSSCQFPSFPASYPKKCYHERGVKECSTRRRIWDAEEIYDETIDDIIASRIRRFGLLVFRNNRNDESFISSNGKHCSKKLEQYKGDDFQISYL